MLVIYAYEFTPVQGPGFTGRKVTLVGSFIKLQSVHVNVVFPYFYIVSLTERKSCVRVAFLNLRPKEGLCTCGQISNASLPDFLAQNSWTTLSVSMLVGACIPGSKKKRDRAGPLCSHSRAQVRLDPSHTTK